MDPSPDPARYLREQTAAEHQATERYLGAKQILGPDFTLPAYVRLVGVQAAVWSAFAAAAPAVAPAWYADYAPLVGKLARAAAADLAGVGGAEPTVDYPKPTTAAELLGATYVHLGSLLGGGFIHAALARRPEEAVRDNLRFYAACADFGRARWVGVQRVLDHELAQPDRREQAVAHARRTFAAYRTIT